MTEGSARTLARRVADRAATVPGIVGVGLGGSVALGTDDDASDVDVGLYYRRDRPPDLAALRELANEVDDRGQVELTELGGWGPRIDGGGWLVVDGRRVDWLYREVESVEGSIAECRAGRSVPVHQPGHPWGWQPQVHAAEAAYGVALWDPDAELERLQSMALPYPERLRAAKLAALWEARFALDAAEKSAARGDVVHVTACLSRVAAALADAIFAVNRRYLGNEKAAAQIGVTVDAPTGVWRRVAAVLAAPGTAPPALRVAVDELRGVLAALESWAVSRP